MDQLKKNKAVVKRLFSELDRHNFGIVDELLADDFVDHAAPPGAPPGREGIRAFYRALYASFPDLRTHIVELIAEDRKVVLQKVCRGTHTGPAFFEFPPRGRALELPIINIFELDEQGRLRQHWHGLDSALVRRQLGEETLAAHVPTSPVPQGRRTRTNP